MIVSYILNNLAFVFFFIGLWGLFVIRSNIILVLICVEMILFSVSMNLMIVSSFFDDLLGQIVVISLLTSIATESAVGLAIVVVYYQLRGTLQLNYINTLKV